MTDDEEDWKSSLSPGARALVEAVDLRHHGVDLERVQRIHLGIDNEPMDFSAETLATMLQEIAEQCEEDAAFTLRAVVRALRGQDDNHKLVLHHKKPGRFVSPTESEEKHNREMSWLHTLASREKIGEQTEAAIAFIAERWGVIHLHASAACLSMSLGHDGPSEKQKCRSLQSELLPGFR